jgi:Sec-independent protein translocase protein TatA
VDNVVEGFFESLGWSIGGVAVAAAVLIGGPRAKTLAKNAIKGYLAATERLREMTAEASESFQDLYAEAKHEYESQLSHQQAAEAEDAATHRDNIPVEIERESE